MIYTIYVLIITRHIQPGATQNRYNLALAQMEFLKKGFGQPHQNVILMGDLNMTAYSKRFINFLKATHLYTYTSLKHHTFTWPVFLPYFLGIQIDHVLFSDNIRIISKSFGSDHRPLIVDLISKE